MLRGRVVIRGHHDDGSRAGKKLARVGALLRVAGHPAHLALVTTIVVTGATGKQGGATAREPLLQVRTLRRQSLGANDADFRETQL